MTNAATIQIGQVSTRHGARDHAITNNRARCGSGRGWIIPTTRRDVTHLDGTARICLHCLPYIRRALADAQHEATAAQGNAYDEATVAHIQAATDATLTDAERAELDTLAAGMAEFLATTDVDANYTAAVAGTIEQAPAVMALPPEQRRRTWADLRVEFAASHPIAA